MNMRRRRGQGGGGLCRESESGVFLTMAELPLRQRGETDPNLTTGNLHVFIVHPGRRSERRLVGPALVLPERLLSATGRASLELQLHLPIS
jgi:hypothetical protein